MALVLLGVCADGSSALETLRFKRGPEVFSDNPDMAAMLKRFMV